MSHSLNTMLNKPGGKLLLLALLAVLAMGWLFLSGMIFLMLVNKDPNQAELLTLYQYWYYYRSVPAVMDNLQLAGLIGSGIIFLPLLLLLIPASRSKNKLFGDARFAGVSEIKKAGLLGDKGIIVGSFGGKYLMFPGQQHAIISAPTRSGKGVGIVIPNLLNWPESIVVLDIKQENWDITSGFRKKHGQTLNPAKDTSEKLQQLQSKFNEILVSSLNHYGKPLDVGTSPLLISEVGGGALSNQKGQENTVALGLNLDEITKAKFLGSDGKKHEMTQSEILRHELFHFVDVNVQDLTLKETRAVWFVNQFQAAEGRALRASYFNPDSAYYPGIVPVTGFSDGRILGVKIPGQRGFPEPSPDFNRWNETQRLNHNNAVEINGQVEPSEMMNLYVRAKETIASNIGDMQPAQQAIILARTHEVVMGNIEQHTSKIADYEKA